MSSPSRDASELLRAMVCINTSSESSKSLMWDSNSLDTKGNWIASKNITFNKDSLPNCAISSNGFGPDNLSWGVDGVTYWIGIKNSAEIKFTGAFGGKNLTGSNTMYFGGTGQFDKASVQVEKTPTEVNGMQVMLISVNYF